ncbi:hypothetical protein K5X82_09200 [Halosquirtibacter xylanolyticus]|uniref:TolB family protein n=1 Tax=Halosquirtibacter xylanolyticus TaxID=3374599 RepID=UPI0037479C1A|nr:hypothetical protein K5X82_09200 [Prolixibacteraceae bacterium]
MKRSYIINLLMILIICITFTTHSTAQDGTGGHPLNTSWKQIDTKAVKVIYPEEIEAQAQKVANYINYLYDQQYFTVGTRRNKVHLILQNNQTQSNGYVGLAPFRSEFYLTPPQDKNSLGDIDWATLLSIHEYRHVLQYSNIENKLGILAYIIAGENGVSNMAYYLVPNWYFEGDAVLSETVLTDQGRGYIPSFFNEQKALALAGKNYNYQKARNGSYKDMVPNHYKLGYNMIRKGRELAQDGEVWKNVMSSTMGLYGLIYPFSSSTKRYTSLKTPALYKTVQNEMYSKWMKGWNENTFTPSTSVLNTKERFVTNYENILVRNNKVYALRSSYAETPSIVSISNNESTHIKGVANISSNQFDVHKNRIVWSETSIDPFYSNRTYSIIKTFDTQDLSIKSLTKKTKYFSPSFSPNGKYIAVSSFSPTQESTIAILSSSTGLVQKEINPYMGAPVSYPKWSVDGNSIIYISNYANQLAIIKQDVNSEKTTLLTPLSNHIISQLDVDDKEVIFSASYNGTDNLYSVPLDGSKNIVQKTTTKVGAYSPAIDRNRHRIYYNEFTHMGTKAVYCDDNQVVASNIKVGSLKDVAMFPITKGKNEHNILPDSIGNKERYPNRSYNGLGRDLSLHTWGYINVNDAYSLGIEVSDFLNNLSFKTSYGRDFSLNRNNLHLNSVYGALPVKLGLTYDKYLYDKETSQGDIEIEKQNITLDQTLNKDQDSYMVNLFVPVRWYGSSFQHLAQIGTNFGYNKLNEKLDITSVRFREPLFQKTIQKETTNSLELQLRGMHNMAQMNLIPKWGYHAYLGYTQTNAEITLSTSIKNDYDPHKVGGNQWNILLRGYAPGLFPNHGLEVTFTSMENSSNELRTLSPIYQTPRGYNYYNVSYTKDNQVYQIYQTEGQSIQCNYRFPICYPDWGFGGIAYLKRVRANIFYDAEKFDTYNTETKAINKINRSSTGIEISLDTQWINTKPVEIGWQCTYAPDDILRIEKSPWRYRFFTSFSF